MNYKGRTPGTLNAITNEIKKSFQLILENNINQFQSDLDTLQPRDRLRLLVDISKLILPKPLNELQEIETQHYTVEIIDSLQLENTI